MYLVFPESMDPEKIRTDNRWEAVLLQPAPERTAHGVAGQTPWADVPSLPALFNPGGLGQPRHPAPTRILAPRDNRASYMLLKSNGRLQFQFRRVPYDYEETIRRLQEDVVWPVPPHERKHGSDIFKDVEGPNPYPPSVWRELMKEYRQILDDMPNRLPKLIKENLVPQLR